MQKQTLHYISTIALIIFFAFIAQSGFSQKAIQLTKPTTGKKLLLKKGQRVEYTLFNHALHYVGKIDSIAESSVTIQGKQIKLDQLKSIGRKRKGSGFWAFASGFVGAGIIIGSISTSNEDPCPSCTTVEDTGGGYAALEVITGLAVLGLGVNTIVRNSPHDLVKKWELRIIDAPVATP